MRVARTPGEKTTCFQLQVSPPQILIALFATLTQFLAGVSICLHRYVDA